MCTGGCPEIADLIASGLGAEQLQFYEIDPGMLMSIFLQQVRLSSGLVLQPVLDRFRDLVQHPNQPRPTAADTTGADGEEARAFYHHKHPSGRAG